MKLITPTLITDAALISSTVAEPDTGETAWVGATNYAVDQIVYRPALHRKYRRRVAGVTATPPESDAENWAYIGGTNRWAMFDDTSAATVETSAPLVATIAPGLCNSIAILGLQGRTLQITVTNGTGGPTVYTRTINLDTSRVLNWYQYFFEPFTTRQVVVLHDLPPYPNARITISLDGPGEVSIAHCIVGTVYDLGVTLAGANVGIRDYSRKTTDEATQIVTLERRRYAKTMRLRLLIDNTAVNTVHQRLEGLRATPCVWIGSKNAALEPLVVYGFMKDFNLDLQHAASSYYSLEIEGMT